MSKLSPKKLLGLVAGVVVVLVFGVFFRSTQEVSDEELGTPPAVVIDSGYNATLSGSPYYFVTEDDENMYDDSLDICDKKGDHDDRLENQNGWYRLAAWEDDLTVREVVFKQVELKEDDPAVIFYYNADDQTFEAAPNKILRNADGSRLSELDLDKKLKKGEVVVMTSSRSADFCVDYKEAAPHVNVYKGWNLIAKPDFEKIDYRAIWEVALAKGGNSGVLPLKYYPSGNNNFDADSLSASDLYWVYVGAGGVIDNGNGQTQEETVNVVVKDKDSGEAMVGVSVVIKGTSTGGTTDADGKVALNTTEDSVTLVVSAPGYKSKEVTVTDFGQDVVIELEPNTSTNNNVETAARLEVKTVKIDKDEYVELGAEDNSKMKSFDLGQIVVDKVVVNGSSTSYVGAYTGSQLEGVLVNGNVNDGYALLRVKLKSMNWDAGAKYRVTMNKAAVVYTDDKVNFPSDDTFEVNSDSGQSGNNGSATGKVSIDQVNEIAGRGTVIEGTVTEGTVEVGETVVVVCANGSSKEVVVSEIIKDDQSVNSASQGDTVGILVRGVSAADLGCGTSQSGDTYGPALTLLTTQIQKEDYIKVQIPAGYEIDALCGSGDTCTLTKGNQVYNYSSSNGLYAFRENGVILWHLVSSSQKADFEIGQYVLKVEGAEYKNGKKVPNFEGVVTVGGTTGSIGSLIGTELVSPVKEIDLGWIYDNNLVDASVECTTEDLQTVNICVYDKYRQHKWGVQVGSGEIMSKKTGEWVTAFDHTAYTIGGVQYNPHVAGTTPELFVMKKTDNDSMLVYKGRDLNVWYSKSDNGSEVLVPVEFFNANGTQRTSEVSPYTVLDMSQNKTTGRLVVLYYDQLKSNNFEIDESTPTRFVELKIKIVGGTHVLDYDTGTSIQLASRKDQIVLNAYNEAAFYMNIPDNFVAVHALHGNTLPSGEIKMTEEFARDIKYVEARGGNFYVTATDGTEYVMSRNNLFKRALYFAE